MSPSRTDRPSRTRAGRRPSPRVRPSARLRPALLCARPRSPAPCRRGTISRCGRGASRARAGRRQGKCLRIRRTRGIASASPSRKCRLPFRARPSCTSRPPWRRKTDSPSEPPPQGTPPLLQIPFLSPPSRCLRCSPGRASCGVRCASPRSVCASCREGRRGTSRTPPSPPRRT